MTTNRRRPDVNRSSRRRWTQGQPISNPPRAGNAASPWWQTPSRTAGGTNTTCNPTNSRSAPGISRGSRSASVGTPLDPPAATGQCTTPLFIQKNLGWPYLFQPNNFDLRQLVSKKMPVSSRTGVKKITRIAGLPDARFKRLILRQLSCLTWLRRKFLSQNKPAYLHVLWSFD